MTRIDDVLTGGARIEGRSVLVPKAAPSYIPDVDWVNSILSLNALSASAVRIIEDGTTRPRAEHSSSLRLNGSDARDVIQGRRLVEAFQKGATVVVDDVGLWDPKIVRICCAIFTSSWRYANASYFLTPAGAKGLPFHADSELTAVFQIAGRKEWDVVDADAGRVGALDELEQSSRSHRTYILSPGDVLFVPERFPHRTRTVGNDASVHLTIGIRQFDTAELIREIALRGYGAMKTHVYVPAVVPEDVFSTVAVPDLLGRSDAWAVEAAKASIRLVTGGYQVTGQDLGLIQKSHPPMMWFAATRSRGVLFANGSLMLVPGECGDEIRKYVGESAIRTLYNERGFPIESLSPDVRAILRKCGVG